tara:strand:+ start:2019 stop:4463 length:2445 start_codon:yes stop_codon:yes gene_type:complete
MSNEVIMEAPLAGPDDPLRYIDSEEVKPSVDAVHDPDPPTMPAPIPPIEDKMEIDDSPKEDKKRKQPEPPVEPRKSKRNKIFPKFFQFESKNEGPGVETNKKKGNKTQKVDYKRVRNTNRNTDRNTKRDTKRTKKDDKRGSSSLVDAAKKFIKKGVKKVETLTGTRVKYVKESISGLLNASAVNLNITATMIKNFLVENKDKLFGMKGKIIRDMIERANSIDQGNSLYGCGSGKTLKPGENSFNWSSSPSNGDDGLVYCWATKVPCAFNLGKEDMAGHGLNHEMEHAVACVRQFMINCLAQIKNLPDDEESIYRRYHNLLIEILKGYLPSVSEDKIIKYVYYIFKMFRRQQVILGLPSISLFNKIKCAINLIDIKFKNENGYLSFILKPNDGIVKKTAKDMDSKESKQFNPPCNMIGSKHKNSAFKSKQTLTQYYERTYKDSRRHPDPALVSKAVKKATAFAAMSTKDKEILLMEQCTKICNEYNSLFDGHSKLSSICSACSIVIVTTIMKSTYVELEIDTKTVPELITWSEKAIEFLKSNIDYLDNDDVLAHIDTKHSDLLAKSQGNVSTVNYLEMNDKTIKDLIDKPEISSIHNMSGGGKLSRESTLLGRQRNERKSNREGRQSSKNKRRMTIVQNDRQGQKGNRYNSRLSKQQMRNQEYNQSQLLRVVDERLQIKENDYYEVYDEYILSKQGDDLSHTMNKFLDLLDCQFTEDEFLDVLIQYDGYDKLDLSDKLGEVIILEDKEELKIMNEYITDKFVCSVECEGEILLPEEVQRDLNSIVNDSARSKKSVKVSKRKKRKKKKQTKRKNKK